VQSKVPQDILPGTRQIPNGLLLHSGNIHRGKVARTHETSQLHGVPAIGLDPIPRLLGNEGGGNYQTGVSFFAQVPVEAVAGRTGLVGEDQLLSVSLEPADELVDIAFSGADGPNEGNIGLAIIGNIPDRDEVLVHIQTDENCGIISHG
jgi:hypothetical protein